MPKEVATEPDQYREYLGLPGRMRLDEKLMGKVDMSGVLQLTLLETSQAGWHERHDGNRTRSPNAAPRAGR